MDFVVAILANCHPVSGRIEPVADPATPMVDLGRAFRFTDLAGGMG
jgi:hypothetical protein